MRNYRTLKVWTNSIDIATKIHLMCKTLPKEELYELGSQMRRCSVSIPSNIAEGAGRNSQKEFDHFLSIALGSAFELETQLIISKNLKYLPENQFNDYLIKLNSLQKMIYGLKKSIKKKK